jgi:arylsulfatase A-like enzyme
MHTPQESPPSLLARGWVGLSLALVVALASGAADAWHARQQLLALPAYAQTSHMPLAWPDFLPTLAAAVGYYGLRLAPLGLVLGLWFGRRRLERGAWVAAWACLLLSSFGLAFWWTRESLYPGLPITSPKRIGLLAALLLGAALAAAPVAWLLARRAVSRWIGPLALLVVAYGLIVASREARLVSARGALTARNQDLPNVLFIVVDALRADRLGCYGHGLGASPHLDRLAEGGVLFENALVQAPYTWTSFGSWFTGKYPRRHGLMKMAPGVALEPSLTMPMLWKVARRPDGQQLTDQDCSGGAFMTGALSHGSGFSQGFDSYVELMMGHPRVDLDSAWSILRARLALPSLLFKLAAKRDPDALVNDARGFLAEHQERRFFAFVHLYSTHTPYDPPEPFRSRFVDPEYKGPIQRFDADIRRVIERGEYLPEPEDVRQIEDLYLGGVAQADHQIGLLLADLERLGLAQNTIVVVTSDHGEDLGESGRYEHNHMYRSNLHVPLLISWPGGFERLGIAPGRRVAAAVESIDLLPTLADLAGLTPGEPRGPREVIDGQSLKGLMLGQTETGRAYTFAEDSTHVSISDGRFMLVLDRYALSPDGWRIACEEGLGTVRLHDLVNDPLQRHDLFRDAYRRPEPSSELAQKLEPELARLRAALLAWDQTMPIGVEEVVQSDRDLESEANSQARLAELAAQRELLIKLGYLQEGDRGSYSGELRERVLELRQQSGGGH